MPIWQRLALFAVIFGPLLFWILRPGDVASPPGYTFVAGDAPASGRLVAQQPGNSASSLLIQAVRDVAPFFDAPLDVAGGFRDQGDRVAQAFFLGSVKNAPVAGVVVVTVADGSGAIDFAFGPPPSIDATIRSMSLPAAVAPGTESGARGTPATQATGWQTYSYPDGSGQVLLPAGWQITVAQRGLVGATGPHGMLHKGLEVEVMSTAHAQMLQGMGSPAPSMAVVADPVDPVSAMVAILPQVGRINGRTWQVTNVRQAVPYPVQYPLSHAAFVDLDEIEGDLQLRCLASVILAAPQGGGIWIYAQSQVCDRPQTFAQNLPVLLQIWGSAETSPQEFRRRFEGVLQSMGEIGEILDAGRQSSTVNLDRGHEAQIEALRGTRVIQDLSTGERFDANLAYADQIVEALNAQPGSPGYAAIPRADLR